jgi:predicted Zn-dependent protease
MASRIAGLITAVALLAGSTVGCVQSDGTRFDPIPGHSRMSIESEREMGWQFDQQAQKMLPMVTDLQVLEFVNDLGNVLVAGLGDQPFDYQFRVIVDPELNAFAVPGGYIYLHTGTLLAAGDVEELAGVMAHELAHVKCHHQARLAQETAIPNLLASLAGIAAGVATGSAGPMIAAQGLNVALQLRYTREFEDEADRVGAIFLTHAGWSPNGMVRFFEKIMLEQKRGAPGYVPPYLYSHPQIASRIDVVRGLAEKMPPQRTPPRLDKRFHEMQARLAYLVAKRRPTTADAEPYDAGRTDPLLETARKQRDAGNIAGALGTLVDAEALQPNDPRVPVLRGDILTAAHRPADAAVAYRRAIHLDPNPPNVLLALADAYRDSGNRREAIFFTEQAVWRSGPKGTMRERAQRALERLIFPVVADSGFGEEPASPPPEETLPPAMPDAPPERVPLGNGRLAYWARLGPHYVGWSGYMKMRWIDPSGKVVREERPDREHRVYVTDAWTLPRKERSPGNWRLEVLLADDVVHTQRFELVP